MGVVESFCGRFGCPNFDLWALEQFNSQCYVKNRYIDDYLFILGYQNLDEAQTLLRRFATMVKGRSTLNLELSMSTESIDFLDIHIYKPPDFATSGKLAYRTHQKNGNKYQYLHRRSLHPPHTFKALIKGELVRYCLTNSFESDFKNMAYIFALRLLARGYTATEFLEVLHSLDYNAVRTSLLCGKPSHSVESSEMEASELSRCKKHFKLQFNSTTCLLKCKPAIDAAVKASMKRIREYTNRDRLHDLLSRVEIEVCHKRAKTLGSKMNKSS
jgi:hypothetical protein